MSDQCNWCHEIFEQDGLHLTIHGEAVMHICPACLDDAKEILLSVGRDEPGKPYEYRKYTVLENFTA